MPDPPEPRTLLRAAPRFWAALALGVLANAAPYVVAPRLPLLDWPQHLATVSALRHLRDPAWGFAPLLELDPQLSYLGFYGVATTLAYALPLEVAARAALLLALVGMPLSCAWLLHRLGRPLWPALFALYAFCAWPVYLGFAPYVFALPLVLLCLAELEPLAEPVASRGALARYGLCALALWLSHPLAFFAFVPMAAASAWARGAARLRFVARAAVATLPALALCGAYVASALAERGLHRGRSQFIVDASRAAPGQRLSTRVFERVAYAQRYLNEGFQDSSDLVLGNVWFLLLALVVARPLVAALRARARGPFDPAWLRGALCVAAAFACYALVPEQHARVWAVGTRLLALAALAAPLLVPVVAPTPARAAPWYALPALLWALATAASNAAHFARAQADYAGLDAALAALPRGQRVACVPARTVSAVTSVPALHAHAYAMAERGGVSSFSFLHVPTHPVRFRGLAPLPFPGAGAEWSAARWRYDLLAPVTDYVLVCGEHEGAPLVSTPAGALTLVRRAGLFALYRNERPRPGPGLYALRENLARAEARYEGPERAPPRCAPLADDALSCGAFVATPVEWEATGGGTVPCLQVDAPLGARLGVRFRDVPAGATELRGLALAWALAGPGRGGASLSAQLDDAPLGERQVVIAGDEPRALALALPRPTRGGEALTVWVSAYGASVARACLHWTLHGPAAPPTQ